MKTILSKTLTLIFFILALVHFYWAIGGKWALESALPRDEKGTIILHPQSIDSIIVGIFLLLFSTLYCIRLKNLGNKKLIVVRKIGLWIVPILFILRAVGDFKYVGFLKQIHGTEFAVLDTFFYSPLCLFIGILGVLLIK